MVVTVTSAASEPSFLGLASRFSPHLKADLHFCLLVSFAVADVTLQCAPQFPLAELRSLPSVSRSPTYCSIPSLDSLLCLELRFMSLSSSRNVSSLTRKYQHSPWLCLCPVLPYGASLSLWHLLHTLCLFRQCVRYPSFWSLQLCLAGCRSC